MKKRFSLKIYGNVQDVNFRYQAQQKAARLNLTGFVRNQPDGSVYAEVEGEEDDLQEFLTWCRQGPSFAAVKKVEQEEEPLINDKTFEIRL